MGILFVAWSALLRIMPICLQNAKNIRLVMLSRSWENKTTLKTAGMSTQAVFQSWLLSNNSGKMWKLGITDQSIYHSGPTCRVFFFFFTCIPNLCSRVRFGGGGGDCVHQPHLDCANKHSSKQRFVVKQIQHMFFKEHAISFLYGLYVQ